jgi:DNA polymerase-3 subunit delta'
MFDDFEAEDEAVSGADEAVDAALSGEPLTLYPANESTDYWGDDKLERYLLDLYNADRLPHGMIFSGIKGIGKATFAYRLARFLLKESESESGLSGGSLFGDAEPMKADTMRISQEDPVFAQVESAAHLDFKLVETEFKPKSTQKRTVIDVSQIRKISDFLRLKSSNEGGWRIALIDDADLMNRNAQNALLKVLEEPPKRTIIILTCHRLGAMLPTIRSRCQSFAFEPLSDQKITELIEQINPALGASELDLILSMSNGSLGRAIELIDEKSFEVISDLQTALSSWPKLDWPSLHMLADRLGMSKDDVTRPTFKNYMFWLFSECIKTKVNRSFLSDQWLKDMTAQYDVKQLLELQDKLKQHFADCEIGSLDNTHYFLGAFFMLPTAKQ